MQSRRLFALYQQAVNLDRLMELLSDLLGEGEPLEPTVTQTLPVTTNAQPTGDSPRDQASARFVVATG